MQRLTTFVFITLLLTGIPGCRGTTPTEPSTTATSTTYWSVVMPAVLTVGVGDTTQIRSVAALRDDSYQVITTAGTWESSDTAVASVDPSGVVLGVAAGTATITLTLDGLTATSSAVVTASPAQPTTFWGGASLPGGATGTLLLSFVALPRVSATLFLPSGAVTLIGRLDSPTNILTLVGSGYAFTGAVTGSVASGTFTDLSGAMGGFFALDATRTAVRTFCGTYTSDGATVPGNPDTGAFVLATSLDGTVAATNLPSDASSPPLIAVGYRSGDAFGLTADRGGTIAGAIQGSTASGAFQTAAGSAATFSATISACH